MTIDCSLFMKIVGSEYLQNMLCTQIGFFCFFYIQNNFGTQHVLQMLRASEKDLPVKNSVQLNGKTLQVLKISLVYVHKLF